MAKHLTDLEIEKIVKVLMGWKGPLSWAALADACEGEIGRKPSRQTLARATRIALAFKTTKDRLKEASDDGVVKVSLSMAAALQRISRLEAENAQMKEENRALLEQFVTWQYNAYKSGLSIDRLNQGLPGIDLNPTESLRSSK